MNVLLKSTMGLYAFPPLVNINTNFQAFSHLCILVIHSHSHVKLLFKSAPKFYLLILGWQKNAFGF